MFCQFLLYSSDPVLHTHTHTHTHTHLFSHIIFHLPSCSITSDFVKFPVLYSRTSLLIHSVSFFFLFRTEPVARGSSQARGHLRAAASGLHHSHSNSGPEPPLRPAYSLWQHWILNPLSKARDWTHILTDTSQVRYCWATKGTPRILLLSQLKARQREIFLFLISVREVGSQHRLRA